MHCVCSLFCVFFYIFYISGNELLRSTGNDNFICILWKSAFVSSYTFVYAFPFIDVNVIIVFGFALLVRIFCLAPLIRVCLVFYQWLLFSFILWHGLSFVLPYVFFGRTFLVCSNFLLHGIPYVHFGSNSTLLTFCNPTLQLSDMRSSLIASRAVFRTPPVSFRHRTAVLYSTKACLYSCNCVCNVQKVVLKRALQAGGVCDCWKRGLMAVCVGVCMVKGCTDDCCVCTPCESVHC